MNLAHFTFLVISMSLVAVSVGQETVQEHVGASRIRFHNYQGCVELKNETTRVVLGHHVGGRILVYERAGKNVLYVSAKDMAWDPESSEGSPPTSAGRFDLGPEYLQLRGPALWTGPWTIEIIGDRHARMTSSVDPKSKFRVTREFKLASDSSRLTIRQTVENTGDQVAKQGYWSRTFAKHGGVAVVPSDPANSRLPNLYYMARERYLVDLNPEDEAIRRVNDFLVIDRPAKFSKLGFDAVRGWVAYQTRDNQLFVKRFPVHPLATYGEPTGINLSIWYPQPDSIPACEIEPIGPWDTLNPGDKSSFQVEWWLLDRAFPENGVVDPNLVAQDVDKHCVSENRQ